MNHLLCFLCEANYEGVISRRKIKKLNEKKIMLGQLRRENTIEPLFPFTLYNNYEMIMSHRNKCCRENTLCTSEGSTM